MPNKSVFIFILCLFSCLISSQGFAEKTTLLKWGVSPISLSLSVNEDATLTFENDVKLLENTSDKLTVTHAKGVLFLRAQNDLKSSRLVLQDTVSQRTIILLVSTDNKKHASIFHLAPEDEKSLNPSKQPENNVKANEISLTRFALQNLFSPERLIETNQAVTRVPMQTSPNVQLLHHLEVLSVPLASWQSGPLFVTAIKETNYSDEAKTLKPRDLKGDWSSVVFYPSSKLAPRGHNSSENVIVVTSVVPFVEALTSSRGSHG